ncbi:MAG: TfoX/Sxy family protein [Pseudomonadota bacterium]
MTPDDVEDIFRPAYKVTSRAMFGGLGVYRDGLMVAIVAYGELFLKVDAVSEPEFVEAGSEPFIYEGGKQPITMRYWRVPAEAYDDPDVFLRFATLAAEAAQRIGPPKKRSRKPKGSPDGGRSKAGNGTARRARAKTGAKARKDQHP